MVISDTVLTEKERNIRLMLLLQELILKEDYKSIELLKTMVLNDNQSMQKSFELLTENIQKEETPVLDNPFPYEHFTKQVKFSDLKEGDIFECYGDEFLNYSYPRICRCLKRTDSLAVEQYTDVSFYMRKDDIVTIR